jgi:hypothetical protein
MLRRVSRRNRSASAERGAVPRAIPAVALLERSFVRRVEAVSRDTVRQVQETNEQTVQTVADLVEEVTGPHIIEGSTR